MNVTFSLRKGIPTMQVHTLKRKEDSSQFPFRCVAVSLRCRANSHKNVRRFGILTKFPFAGTLFSIETKNTRSRAFAFRLGATHPCPIAVHTEPFSTSVFKGHTWIVATSTKICTRHRSTRFHNLTLLNLMSTPPYFLSNICFAQKHRISPPL